MSNEKGWTYEKTLLKPTQSSMKIAVLPIKLPKSEQFAADVTVGERTSVSGARREIVRISIWRDGLYVISSFNKGRVKILPNIVYWIGTRNWEKGERIK